MLDGISVERVPVEVITVVSAELESVAASVVVERSVVMTGEFDAENVVDIVDSWPGEVEDNDSDVCSV